MKKYEKVFKENVITALFSGEINFMKNKAIPLLKQNSIKILSQSKDNDDGILEVKVEGDENKLSTIGSSLENLDKKDAYGGWFSI